jgi:hypothetical protein
MSQWTEKIEKSLITMRQNAKKLAETYLETYNAFRIVTAFVNVPSILLSALNAYVIYASGSFSAGVHLGSSAASLGIAVLLSCEIAYVLSCKPENTFSKYKDFAHLEKAINQVIATAPDLRKVDADSFLKETFDLYKTLVAEERLLLSYLRNVADKIEGEGDDIIAILDDHWNILFRPKLRHIKHKNQKVIDALKLTGQDVQTTVESGDLKTVVIPTLALPATTTATNWFSSFQIKQEPTTTQDIESQVPEPVPDLVSAPVVVNEEVLVIPVNELAVPISATLDALASVKNEKSWGSSFWKGNKEKAEDNHPDVELANLYPDNQTVKYEPMKRTGFAMKFGERI